MKKYFTTGLALLLPIALTLIILCFVINILTKPFLKFTERLLVYYNPSLELQDSFILIWSSKLLILVSLFVCVFLLGFLGRIFFFKSLLHCGDYLIHRIPFVNSIYKASQDLVNGVFSNNSTSFSKVVLVPFPTLKSFSVGFVTKEHLDLTEEGGDAEELIPVFVPGTPNPSVGFMLMFRRREIHFVDMTIEKAMKMIISCGVAMPDFIITSETENKEKFNGQDIK